MINFLWKIYNYYYYINYNGIIWLIYVFSNDNWVNNFLIGKSNCGKICFINELFEEKIDLENEGMNVTDKKYEYPYINRDLENNINKIINLFEILGVALDDKVIEKLKKEIKDIFN